MTTLSRDQLLFFRTLNGPAAQILIVMILSGSNLMSRDLEHATGLSDKTVAKGLRTLKDLQMIQYHGRSVGWSLDSGIRQLELFPTALLGWEQTQAAALQGLPAEKLSTPVDKLTGEFPDSYGGETGEFPTSSSRTSHVRVRARFATAAAKDSPTQIDAAANQQTAETGNFPDNARAILRSKRIKAMLIDAGVGARSKKMSELLAMGLDPEYVKAHVDYRKKILASGRKYRVGLLIKRLLDEDPAPAGAQRSSIPEQYRDFVKT